jgi:hypothetical protein
MPHFFIDAAMALVSMSLPGAPNDVVSAPHV